jgi:hypothetical protein
MQMHLYGFWDRHVLLNGANHSDAINLSFILDENVHGMECEPSINKVGG